jgi:hypothetical protein
MGLFLSPVCLVVAGWDTREGLDPSSSDKVESLPVRAMFSCAYALFILLPSPTDLGYAHVKPAGALSHCWAEATKGHAPRMASSWSRSCPGRVAAWGLGPA